MLQLRLDGLSRKLRAMIARRLHVLAVFAAVIVFAACHLARGATTSPANRMNVVLIVADDLGWRDLGCFGSTFYETPHLDRLAGRGMRLTSCYAAPVCSPTRASLMTGKYPVRVGVTDYIAKQDGSGPYAKEKNGYRTATCSDRLRLEEVTLAEAFRQAGYATGFAGKWHLGPQGYWPEDQGFDVNRGGCAAGSPTGRSYFSPYRNPRLSDGPPGEHLDERLASETVNFIRQQQAAAKPFFAELALYSVHIPLMAPEELVAKYQKKIDESGSGEVKFGTEGKQKVRLTQNHAVYGAMVEMMDRAVGRVIDALDEIKLADNTIVVFLSDNGGLATAEGTPTSNLPLRAGKGWLYEGGVRVPGIVVWPGHTKPGGSSDAIVSSTDWYPTLLEMTGLAARPQQDVDGVSVAAVLDGKPVERGPIFWHYPHFGNQGGFPGGAVRNGNFKLVQNYLTQKVELFDLSKDISEKNDLSETMPDKRDELLKKLKAWQESVKAEFPTKL